MAFSVGSVALDSSRLRVCKLFEPSAN